MSAILEQLLLMWIADLLLERISGGGDRHAQRACARPPKRLKKRRAGLHASQPGVQTPARPPPHAARRPHAYKWREDGRLGVWPRRTGVLAMHACLEGVQALHALRTGVHGWHACPARLT
ncbi:hypothetical protein PCANC_23096 [Puccinia coronata f. sp. avenae]|uniref:Uncharacterized protein n=1 Tax=Puccinia coronata f. sp. avenae TaxID=200324 RepID=A0A2N5U6G3_9BASI|nr:hypothetical protein PCANC_23096 [Puccinia coronata f. sp. avenae]